MYRTFIADRNVVLKRLPFVVVAVLLLFVAGISCRDEDSVSGRSDESSTLSGRATLTLQISGFRPPSGTRVGVDEEAISELDVFLFHSVSGSETVAFMQHVSGSELHATSISGEASLSMSIPAGVYSRLVLVANAHVELTSSGIATGSSYASLGQVETRQRYGQMAYGGIADKQIPMYGEYKPSGGIDIRAGEPKIFPETVSLIRSMARVDIINQATNFQLVAMRFYNAVENGTVYVNPTTYTVGYTAPTLPASLIPVPNGHGTAPYIEISVGSPTYYLYEQRASDPAVGFQGMSRPRIVVWGNYEGNCFYYPLDYMWDGVKAGGTKGTPMPILRNHRYIFTIKEIKGKGYASEEEAATAPESMTNGVVVATMHVLDGAYTDIVYDRQGFLAVSRTEMKLQGKKTTASTDNKVEILTNIAGGFKVIAFNSNGIPPSADWLQSSVPGGVANSNTTVQAITDGKGERKGYLEVRAGRLYTKVNVDQIGRLPLEYVAEHNLAGGFQYRAYFSSGAPITSAQTDPQFRWAINHNNDQSGYYNWYKCTGNVDPNYNPYGVNLFNDDFFKPSHPGYGYHLPSKQELTGVFSYNGEASYSSHVNSVNVNEAIKFGSTKMTFASDYYSIGNDVCYALRFKAATDTPNDGSSLSEFPKATDNSMLCAYRYTRVGSFGTYDLTSMLKVQCVYLGSGFTGTINDISNDAWWSARSAETVTRIFSAAGYVRYYGVYSSGQLSDRGRYGGYWSDTEYDSSKAWSADLYWNRALVNHTNFYEKRFGLSIRLFADD
ncbi:hypothetical protein M1B74_00700 [Bacteroides pyogenes]|uniref:hypothetical protein n=1 Tax=Bacteroides pyogenes TaxID=310300 RepID=UPI003B4385A6